MSILFVSAQNSMHEDSENNAYYIRDGLDRIGLPVKPFTPRKLTYLELLRYGPTKAHLKLRGMDYRLSLHPHILQRQGEEIAATARDIGADLILANAPYVVTQIPDPMPPLVLYMDAPSAAFVEMGHYYDRWDRKTIQRFIDFDRETIQRASLVVYHSRWAVQQAIQHYGISPDKFDFVTPGANLPYIGESQVRPDIPEGPLTLLFFGRDWVRKGGERFVEIGRWLRKQGIDARLVVSGPVSIPREHLDQPWLTFEGRLSKTTPSGLARIQDLFRMSHFLIAPTFAESSTAALREAAGYGLPSVSTQVGAHSEIMCNGVDCVLLPSGSSSREFADAIGALWSDRDAYLRMRRDARSAYETRLTWESSMTNLSRKLMERSLLGQDMAVSAKNGTVK